MDNQVINTVNNQTYAAYCSFRLPCGICTRTNMHCPIATGNTISSPYTYEQTCIINSGTTNSGGKITST